MNLAEQTFLILCTRLNLIAVFDLLQTLIRNEFQPVEVALYVSDLKLFVLSDPLLYADI